MSQRTYDAATKTARQLGVAIIGCGAWGPNLARNFHALGALAAIHDHTHDHAVGVAQPYGLTPRDFDDILGDDTIDAVALATPSGTHHAMAREALVAAKHVFVEKPLALRSDHAAELIDIADRRGLTLMVGHLMLYHPAFERLSELAAAGALGEIRHIDATRLGPPGGRHEHCVVWDLAPHDIAMVLALYQDLPRTVIASGDRSGPSEGSKVAMAALDFGDGRSAHLQMSWMNPTKQRRLTVIGTKATAVFDDGQDWPQKLILYTDRDGGKHADAVDLQPAEPLALECRHFLDCIASGIRPRTDGSEGRAVLRVLEAIGRAIADQTAVQVEASDSRERAEVSAE